MRRLKPPVGVTSTVVSAGSAKNSGVAWAEGAGKKIDVTSEPPMTDVMSEPDGADKKTEDTAVPCVAGGPVGLGKKTEVTVPSTTDVTGSPLWAGKKMDVTPALPTIEAGEVTPPIPCTTEGAGKMTEVTAEPCTTEVTGFSMGAGKKTKVTLPLPWTTEVTTPSVTAGKITDVTSLVPPMTEVTARPL